MCMTLRSFIRCEGADGCQAEATTDHKRGGFLWFVCADCAAALETGKRDQALAAARRAFTRTTGRRR